MNYILKMNIYNIIQYIEVNMADNMIFIEGGTYYIYPQTWRTAGFKSHRLESLNVAVDLLLCDFTSL